MKPPFQWDNYSDQPALLKDREYKKSMRKKKFRSLLKTFFIALFILPLSLVAMPFVRRKTINSQNFFSLGVDFEREPQLTDALIQEIGVNALLVRLKLWKMEKLKRLQLFLEAHKSKHITLKILQDREHIENLELLKKDLDTIFTTLENFVNIYEIGSSINRAKWGFFSVNEYLKFYKVAYDLKKEKFPTHKLMGSGVIDFEYHFTAHTLFNFCKCKYDAVASLLYVDRLGAPENIQLGFALSDKIAYLSSMVWLSPKVGQELHITETNWTLSHTAPYAPTSEKECVSEDLYSDYMLRYYFLCFASQQVESVSWHQLIASGYGLIDAREGIRKRKAFYAYKFMYNTLHKAQFLRLDIKRDYYISQCLVDDALLQIHWSLIETTLQNENFFACYSSVGHKIDDATLTIGSDPVYIYITKAAPKKINCL